MLSQPHIYRHFSRLPLFPNNLPGTFRVWPITIITQPSDIVDCEDHIVSFKVVISGGTDPVSYAWQRQRPDETDFTDIPSGAPNITYPVPGTIRIDNVGGNENPGGTRYRVIISDAGGTITSASAQLTVNEITDVIPSVAFPLKTNVIICRGSNFSYTVTTSGTPPVAFQWKKYVSPGIWMNLTNNSIISGSNSAVLSFTGATPAESGQYKVNITFHSSGADCQIQSNTRIRVLTVEDFVTSPVIQNDITVTCQDGTPDILQASPASGGSGTYAYQWESSPDNVSWSSISGATTLTYQPPLPQPPCWYRITTTDNGQVPCGSAVSSPIQLTTTDCNNLHYRTRKDGFWQDRTIWETSPDGMNWGGTAYTYPTSSMLTITIRNEHHVNVTGNVSVDQVTVESGGSVTVNKGHTLTNARVASDFVIHSSATTSGSLMIDGIFAGELSYRRYLEPGRWYIASSPVKINAGFGTNAPRISFNVPSSDFDFAWYREENNQGWTYYPSLPDRLDPAKAYAVRTSATCTVEKGIIEFSGSPNGIAHDTVSPMVYNTGTRNGWNAIGNPFTSTIGITELAPSSENFLNRNADIFEDSYAAIYVWNQTGPYDGSQQYYKAIGNSGYNYSGFSYYAGANPDILQTGQGFLINVKATSRAIFSKAMQIHTPEVLMKSTASDWKGLSLQVKQGSNGRNTIIAFNKKMTTGLDKTYDAGLLSTDRFQIFTRLVTGDTGIDLEVQCLPDIQYGNLTIPVGLSVPEGGKVTFTANGVILPEGWVPVLEDRLYNIFTFLKLYEEGYTTRAEHGAPETGRFYLHFSRMTPVVETFELQNYAIHFEYEKILIRGKKVRGSRVTLLDINGRILGIFQLHDENLNEFQTGHLSPGIYLIRMENDKKTQVFKVIYMGR